MNKKKLRNNENELKFQCCNNTHACIAKHLLKDGNKTTHISADIDISCVWFGYCFILL